MIFFFQTSHTNFFDFSVCPHKQLVFSKLQMWRCWRSMRWSLMKFWRCKSANIKNPYNPPSVADRIHGVAKHCNTGGHAIPRVNLPKFARPAFAQPRGSDTFVARPRRCDAKVAWSQGLPRSGSRDPKAVMPMSCDPDEATPSEGH